MPLAGNAPEHRGQTRATQPEYDYVVIGSGFGGSVAALRLSEKGYRVAVIEQGRHWPAQDLPKTNWDLRRWIWRPSLGLRGFFGMSFFRHFVVLHGNAVGGGSITYGNVLLVPPDSVWRQGSWAGLNDWERVMPAHYATARRMLGAVANPRLGPADLRLKEMAAAAGAGGSFYRTEVGVFFGKDGDEPGTAYDDPYFGGEGPSRKSCIACGGCMVGCGHLAKNTLDKNYLHLAQKRGAALLAESKAVDVRPVGDRGDGADGYTVQFVSLARGSRGLRQWVACRGVVFAASSLGTQDLLFRLRAKGSLPRVSEALGGQVRTNAESLIAIRFPGSKVDLSQGVAIGSGFYIDEHTNIEVVRYPNGSDAMSLLATVMTRGRLGRMPRLAWLAALLGQLLRKPAATLRALWPSGWARETMILLCMQTLDGHLTMRLKRPWYWPFSRTLATQGPKVPTYIPAAHDFAIRAAEAAGGVPQASVTEIILNVPMTAHCLGGAAMGRTRADGVCDGRNRVFGYRNMYICDSSMIAANLGVNPSLTIAALTEHAMSHLPGRADQKWDDAAGDDPGGCAG